MTYEETRARYPGTQRESLDGFDSFFRSEYQRMVRLGVALTGDLASAEDLARMRSWPLAGRGRR